MTEVDSRGVPSDVLLAWRTDLDGVWIFDEQRVDHVANFWRTLQESGLRWLSHDG